MIILFKVSTFYMKHISPSIVDTDGISMRCNRLGALVNEQYYATLSSLVEGNTVTQELLGISVYFVLQI